MKNTFQCAVVVHILALEKQRYERKCGCLQLLLGVEFCLHLQPSLRGHAWFEIVGFALRELLRQVRALLSMTNQHLNTLLKLN